MRLREVVSIFVLFFFFTSEGSAQLESSTRYFGPNCSSLHFSPNNNVTVMPNGYTPYGAEGCSVLSDPTTGIFKFYTDGIKVIDANHKVMPNGSGLIGTLAMEVPAHSKILNDLSVTKFSILTHTKAYEYFQTGDHL